MITSVRLAPIANPRSGAAPAPKHLEQRLRVGGDGSIGLAARRADLGRVARRVFVNVASAGLSAMAARAARPHKRRLGTLAHAVGAVKAGLTAEPLRCRVLCDGDSCYAGAAWQVVVAVTGAFGGGSVQQGGFEVVVP